MKYLLISILFGMALMSLVEVFGGGENNYNVRPIISHNVSQHYDDNN